MSKTQIIDEILKSHKKPGFRSFFKRWIFRKTVGRGGQIDLPAVSGLIKYYLQIIWHIITWKLQWRYPLIDGLHRWCHYCGHMDGVKFLVLNFLLDMTTST